MKKVLLFAAVAASLGLASCNSEGYEQTTLTFSVPTVNVITSLSDGTTVASSGSYNFDLITSEQTGIISSNNVVLNGTASSLMTSSSSYSSDGRYANFKSVDGFINGLSTYPVDNGKFLACQAYATNGIQTFMGFYFVTSPAGKYTYSKPVSDWNVIAQYQIGEQYMVKTFQTNPFYAGTTTTSYVMNGTTQTNETENIIYRISLDVSNNTAALIIYNAKFSASPNEPVKAAIIAEGLTVSYSEDGITITGQDITPDVVDGSSVTPNPSFKFNNITFKTTGADLTECSISYQVAGMYNGEFTGSYIYKPSNFN